MNTKIFGIINLTPDSFSGDGIQDIDKIIKYINTVADYGFYGVDVGAFSTKPNGFFVPEEEELSRLKLLPKIIEIAHNLNIKVSLDSFRSGILEFGLKLGIDYINDVSGFKDINIVNLALKYRFAKCICMHSIDIPTGDNIVDKSLDIVDFIIKWSNNKIKTLIDYGIEKDRIIIDLGVGFGKDAEQSWKLLKNFAIIKKNIDTQIYIGHSRKSFLKNIADTIEKLDIATLLISQKLISENCNYLRVHNIDYIKIYKDIYDFNYLDF